MKPAHWHIGVAILGAALIAPAHRLATPVAAAVPANPYKYVIGRPRLNGITDGADAERKAIQQLVQSGPIDDGVEIVVADACDTRQCDLVFIVETPEHVFKVSFHPSDAELQKKDHTEKETRRQPYPTERLVWQQGSREIANLITTHTRVHASPLHKSAP